jgi:phosphoribosyl-ATP pyrophosphohydrolase/phosphoribosyl-AMP cyclohydrolase
MGLDERELVGGLDWEKGQGLLPAVVQDAETLQVLMVAYVNREALAETLRTRRVTFFSRSRGQLWTKGETSGNTLELVGIEADCDRDALLVRARPAGPTCHEGTTSCFGGVRSPGIGFLAKLAGVVAQRDRDRPEGSYTTKLFSQGLDRIAQKVGEEGVEVVIAAKNDDPLALRGEAADLLFHLLVLLQQKKIPLGDVIETLRERHPHAG